MVCDIKEVEVNVAPHRLWAAMKDGHNLLPKVMTDEVAKVEQEGYGPGSIRKVHFHPEFASKCGAHFIKEKLLHVDDAARTTKIEVLEGGPIGKYFSKLVITSSFAPGKDDCHTLAKLESEYESIADTDEVTKMQAGSLNMIKQIESYLVANPQEYA